MKVKDFLGNEWEYDCLGCAIGKNDVHVPGGFIKKTEYFCVHQDPLIPLPGFIVIGALRHIHTIAEMDENEYGELAKIIKVTQRSIKKTTGVEYLTIIQEENSIHFHVWFFPWTKDIIEKYGNPSLSKIRNIMNDLRNKTINDSQWDAIKTVVEKMKNDMEK